MLRVCFNSYESYTTDQVYQWDQNHTLRIVGLNLDYAPAIHFANKKSTEAIVVHSTKDGEDITAPIPNLLLQEPYNIIAYIHIYDVEDENAKTIEVINIPLIKRIKPSEYQFEDNSDIMNFERLETDIADFIATMTEDFETYKAELQEEIETKETNIKNYADERDLFWVENVLDNTQVSIENGDKDTLEEAKSYSDANLETAKKYSDENQEGAKTYANTTVLAATIASARAYADGQDGINLASAKTYSDTGDSTTLASAKTYADTKSSSTLTSAKSYADTKASTTLSSAKTYSDNKFTSEFWVSTETGSIIQSTICTISNFSCAVTPSTVTISGVFAPGSSPGTLTSGNLLFTLKPEYYPPTKKFVMAPVSVGGTGVLSENKVQMSPYDGTVYYYGSEATKVNICMTYPRKIS